MAWLPSQKGHELKLIISQSRGIILFNVEIRFTRTLWANPNKGFAHNHKRTGMNAEIKMIRLLEMAGIYSWFSRRVTARGS